MSQARPYPPGTTWVYSRRTANGAFRFIPSAVINAIFLFALAIAALRYNIAVHAFIAMTNHIHVVATDLDGGKLPYFMNMFHSTVARGVALHQSEPGPVWDSSGPDLKMIDGPETALSKIVYTLANAAAADLCERPEDWLGAMSPVALIGAGPIEVERPEVLNTDSSKLDDTAELVLVPPPQHADKTATEFRQLLQRRLDQRATEILEQRKCQGRSVMPKHKLLGQGIFDRPKTHPAQKPRIYDRRKAMRRHVECDPELHEAAVDALIGFRDAYKQAFKAWRKGKRGVVFPYGTWAMKRIHGARVARVAPAPD